MAILYIGGCRRAGEWLVKEDVPVHADAMVMLTGSIADRVLQGVDLYRKGRAGQVLIVEEGMGPYKLLKARGADIVSSARQMQDAAKTLGIPADSITVLPGEALSTKTEATIIRDYLAGSTVIDTILLVTSAPHTRRALMIFRAAFRDAETPVYIGCSPNAYSDFDAKYWWRDREDVQAVLSEFVKIGSFVLFEKRGVRSRK
jgi:uncharacterized SAM-binding protein YcdF (DUF218 family)